MRVAILSANLGSFDVTPKDPVEQKHSHGWEMEVTFHRFTDKDFPPIAGLSGRFQYRIPKLFGWDMFPGYDYYIWLDSSMSFERPDCVEWFLKQLGDADAAFFRHPWRGTIQQEVDHLETKLNEGNKYLVPRYKNGLHKEVHALIKKDPDFVDNHLYASNVFIYRNNEKAREMLRDWWYFQSRYFTCDQVALPYAIHMSKAKVSKIPENLFKIGYVSLVSHH